LILPPRISVSGLPFYASRPVSPSTPTSLPEFRKVSVGIVDQCDETVQLGILDGTDIVHISRTESSHPLRFITPIGRRYAAHTTGLGKVLLSALSDEQIAMLYGRRPLVQPTPNSISSVADLKRELQRVRRQKWATDHEETLIGLTCVAAPIYDAENKMIAAVSISLPVARWSAQRAGNLTQIVIRGARDISILMGAPARKDFGVR
jgi:IclR family transcriptional regulator, KDG regulon repressor